MSSAISVTSSWPGFPGIKRLVIFGDSYSAVTLQLAHTEKFHPDANNPLGVEYPGVTYNERDQPNWVGHLLTKHYPGPRYNPDGDQDDAWKKSPLLVYDYARGGDQVMGVKRQIQNFFLPIVGKKPEWADWNSNNTLFVTWVGINDCAWTMEYAARIDELFSLHEELYDAGARNFVFVNLPPIERSPAFQDRREWIEPTELSAYLKWNMELRDQVRQFSEKHPDSTVLLFSAHQTFTAFLDDLWAYDFNPGDGSKAGGSVWVDHLHPTSKVHDIIAHNFADFLSSITPLNAA